MKCSLNIDKLEIAFNENAKLSEYLNGKHKVDFSMFTMIRNLDSDYANDFNIILDDGTKFANIYFGSFNPNRKKVYLMIANYYLYTDKLNLILEIATSLDLVFDSISKFDLALDFNINIINKFYKLLKDDTYEFIILNKKFGIDVQINELLNLSVGTRKNIHQVKSFYIQNKEKGLTLNGYNKLKEITDNGNVKAYIKDKLKYKQIYRLEVRTNHKLLIDTLKKLGYTDEYLFECIVLDYKEELFEIYNELLKRLVRIEYNKKIYSLLEFL